MHKYLLSFLYQTFPARIFLETIYSLYPRKLSLSRQIGFRFDAKRFLAEIEEKCSIDFLAEIKLTGTGFQKNLSLVAEYSQVGLETYI